jgi:hypothetical protein
MISKNEGRSMVERRLYFQDIKSEWVDVALKAELYCEWNEGDEEKGESWGS